MIKKLNRNLIDFQSTSVYDFNELTLQDLLSKFFDKINNCIDVSNQALSFLEWLKEEGLPIEVQKEIEKMYLDGRLTEIINQLANDVKGQVTEIKQELAIHKTEYEQFKTSTNETLKDHSSQLEHIAYYLDEKIIPEVNYTNALQRTIEKCSKYGTIKLPQGVQLDFNEITINKPLNIEGGILNGTLKIDIEEYSTNFTLEKILFLSETPVLISQLRDATIRNCCFKNSDKSISMLPYKTSGQSIARIKIENNIFIENNYCLYGETVTDNNICIADIHFIGNMCKWSNTSQIQLSTIDGIIISDNTMFQNKVYTKRHHIEVMKWCNWVVITNNNLFESGTESIKLCNPNQITITNNNFAWCGQIIRCATIKIYSTNSTPRAVMGHIKNNTVSIPSQTGVELDNVDFIDVVDNIIHLERNNNQFIGSGEIDASLFKGVVVKNNNSVKGINIDNKINISNSEVNDTFKFLGQNKKFTKYISDGETTPNGAYDIIQINSNVTISNLLNPTENKEVLLYSNSTSIVVQSNSNIRLLNSENITLNSRDTLLLKYMNGAWQEISRTQKNGVVSPTIRDNTSTLDVSNGAELIALANTSATNISTINGGYTGKIIKLIAYNGNTTIVNGGNIKLKNSINVTLANTNILTLIYHGGNWYEDNRNF